MKTKAMQEKMKQTTRTERGFEEENQQWSVPKELEKTRNGKMMKGKWTKVKEERMDGETK